MSCIVPKTTISSSRWARHLYHMMVEAGVTITPHIADHYHAFVACLQNIDGLRTQKIDPRTVDKYRYAITINTRELLLAHFPHELDTQENIDTIYDTIIDTYKPLFDCIKDIVVPYMDMKHKHVDYKRQSTMLQRDIANQYIKMEQLIAIHEQHMRQEKKVIMNMKQKQLKLEKKCKKYEALCATHSATHATVSTPQVQHDATQP